MEGQPFPLTAHFFLLLFTVLVSIILMNLLVGLAVSDIQGLSKSAKLDQLIQQVCKLMYHKDNLYYFTVQLVSKLEPIPHTPIQLKYFGPANKSLVRYCEG